MAHSREPRPDSTLPSVRYSVKSILCEVHESPHHVGENKQTEAELEFRVHTSLSGILTQVHTKRPELDLFGLLIDLLLLR
jgi:hypothetical protein